MSHFFSPNRTATDDAYGQAAASGRRGHAAADGLGRRALRRGLATGPCAGRTVPSAWVGKEGKKRKTSLIFSGSVFWEVFVFVLFFGGVFFVCYRFL